MDNVLGVKLANQFASSQEPDAQSLLEEYTELNLSARAGAEKLSSCCKLMRDEWTKLLPILARMQALLSQRGADHGSPIAAGLPTWTIWLEQFLNETGLTVTMRAVQKQLAKLRVSGEKNAAPTDSPLKLSTREQRRLLTATQCANELIQALESGAEYRPAMEEFKRISMSSDKIEQLLESMPSDAVPSTMPPVLVEQAAGNGNGLATIGTQQPVTKLQPRAALPRPGGGIGLANYVVKNCDKGIAAAFAGLRPSEMACCFQQFVHKLAEKYLGSDLQRWEIRVHYVPAGTDSTQRAA